MTNLISTAQRQNLKKILPLSKYLWTYLQLPVKTKRTRDFYYSLSKLEAIKMTIRQARWQWWLAVFAYMSGTGHVTILNLGSISRTVNTCAYVLKQEEILLNRAEETSLKCLLFKASAKGQGWLSLLNDFFSVCTVTQQCWKYQSFCSYLLKKKACWCHSFLYSLENNLTQTWELPKLDNLPVKPSISFVNFGVLSFLHCAASCYALLTHIHLRAHCGLG